MWILNLDPYIITMYTAQVLEHSFDEPLKILKVS